MFTLKNTLWAMALAGLLGMASCRPADNPATAAEQANPTWLTQLIGDLEKQQPANPPARILRYTYQGQEVYYLTGRCCDVPSQLFDAAGNVICEPDGGITGRGDGRCTDFFEQRQNETVVWEDKRKS